MTLRLRRKKKTSDVVQTLVKAATASQPLQPWQGYLLVQTTGAAGSRVKFSMNLAFLNRQLEGTGDMKDFPRNIKNRDSHIQLNGSYQRTGMDCEIWVHAEKVSREPIQLTGQFNRTLSKAEGTWHIRCFNRGTCDCQGTSGEFKMWKDK